MTYVPCKAAMFFAACCWLNPAVADAKESAGSLPPAKAGQIRIEYVTPVNPAHQEIYERLKARHVLEQFKDFLGPLRLPGPLKLRFAGCDGESNAWYEAADHTVTVCYEYIDEVLRNADKETMPAGVTREDAIAGPAFEVFLHEIAHALFDMLRVPILGREEDAADQIAAYSLLQLGKDEARRTVVGVAYMYGHEALAQEQGQTLKLKQFADVHGLPAQRFYNLLCMAYGADQRLFADLVEKKYLPESRAEGCADEYKQVAYAVHKLITPYIDQKLSKQVKARKWLKPPAAAKQ